MPPRSRRFSASAIADAQSTAQLRYSQPSPPAPARQGEADRINMINQAVVGANEGATEAITEKVGSDITDAVLRTADSTDYRSIDDYELHDLVNAAIQGADQESHHERQAPPRQDCTNALLRRRRRRHATRTHTPRQRRARNQRSVGPGVSSGSPNHPPSLRAYNFAHTNDSITVILRELAGADGVRKLNEAPSPTTGAANAVTDQIAYLTSLLHQQPVDDTKVQPMPPSRTVNPPRARLATAHATTPNTQQQTVSSVKAETGHVRDPSSATHTKPTLVSIAVVFAATANILTFPRRTASGTQNLRGLARNGCARRWASPTSPASSSPLHVYAADPPSSSTPTHILSLPPPVPIPSTFKLKAMRRLHARQHKRAQTAADNQLLDQHITWAEDERTAAAKADILHPRCQAINNAHTRTSKPAVSLLQASKNTGYALATNIRRTLHKCLPAVPHVTFQAQAHVRHFHPNTSEPMITYDSGADGHYLSEADRHTAKLPILCPSTKRVGVANGSTSMGKHATTLPFPLLSPTAAAADSFDDFPTSLMSVGKTSDDGTISIFTKDGVTIHKEQDVLITCHGKPLLIGVRDEQGRYRIPLVQHRGQWQPRIPSKKARAVLNQAHSVYDLPSTEQAIKWMHAVCGYPVKSTWLKAIQAGNFVGWPLLTVKNVHKYYPDSAEMPRDTSTRHARTSALPSPNRRPSKKSTPLNSGAAKSKTFTPLPTSSAILVEPIKNRTDAELTRAYSTLMLRLRRAGIVPRKHVLDNEISAAMKDLIQDTYKMSLELVPPGCHRRNAAEVAIRNFKSHFLSILAGVADDFPLKLWDKLLPQTEITLNLLRQSNATPTVSAYAHLNGPFDYNKMPLAPMGCNAQVHEKTDSRGTWAFHSVDGCHCRLLPALLTHAPPKGASNPRQLQELLQHTSTRLNSAGPQPPPPHTPHPPPRVEQRIEQPPPRVLDPNMRITRSMTTLPPAIPPVPIPVQHGTSPRDDDTPPAYLAPSPPTHQPGTRDPKQQRSPNSPYLPHSTRDRELPASRLPHQLPNDKPHA
eukprot:CCRYP_016689-RA/>CCRYP_016689-RA protein AED:0.31 eAED:0.36 QI:0/0/0/1/1/1/5/0/1039